MPAYLITPTDLDHEAELLHPDGTREPTDACHTAPVLGITLAVAGYLAPSWPVRPGTRYRLCRLPALPCPPWCPSTPAAHRHHADGAARPFLEHLLHLPAGEDATVTVRQIDRCHPHRPGAPTLAVLGDNLDGGAALDLAATLSAAVQHLSAPPPPPGPPAERTGTVLALAEYRR